MANPSTAFGFQFNGLLDGESPNFGIRTVQLSPSNSHHIYGGDPASVISGGYYDVASVVVGGEPLGGVFLPDFVWPSISAGMTMRSRAWLGNTADIVATGTLTAKLVVSKSALFKVRSRGNSGAAVAQASVGRGINFYGGAGPGNNLISTFSVDENTIGDQPTLPFTIYKLLATPETDPTSTYNELLVMFRNLQQ